jgi:hypothetical protein
MEYAARNPHCQRLARVLTAHGEQRAAEARAAAFEEAAQVADREYRFSGRPISARQLRELSEAIRALAAAPPQPKSPNPFHHCDDCTDQDCYAFGCRKYGNPAPPQPEGGEG